MNRCLIVSMDDSALPFVRTLNMLGVESAFLDFCLHTNQFVTEQAHRLGAPVIKVGPSKSAVLENEQIRTFDTAVIFEGPWLESALIVQALKQAGLQKIIVVAQNQSYMRAYRALGADRVVGVKRWSRDSLRVLYSTDRRGA
jgi:Trk K+ transport system NAD-binding subunit